jgi:hypothetical protein
LLCEQFKWIADPSPDSFLAAFCGFPQEVLELGKDLFDGVDVRSIENSLHWVLDMSFDEDRARNRKDNGPENLSTLRKLTLNILRKARPKRPVSRNRKSAGWSDDFAKSIIGQMR